jgi:ABC-type glycerol-3-phosphate transport system substrate-binding protein
MTDWSLDQQRMSRRRFIAVGAGAAATFGLAACGGSSGGSTGSTGGGGGAGQTINVGMEAGSPNLAFFQKLAPAFTKETGIKVKFVGVPHESMRQQFLTAALAGQGSFDVYETDQPWVPQFAAAKYLVNLDDRIAAEDRADFQETALATVSYQDGLYGLPFLVHNPVLYYRTDLFERAGIAKPPATWDEYRQTAKELTAGGVHGTLIEGKRDGEVAVKYMSLLQQAGGDLVDAQGKVIFDGDPARQAFDLMLGIVDDGSAPGGLTDLTDAQGLFMGGKLAMVPQWPYMFPLSQDKTQSKVAGQVALAPQPGLVKQVGTVFSWGFGIASSSQKQDAAWEWVKWSTNTDALTKYGEAMVNPVPRKSALKAIDAASSIDAADRKAIATFAGSVGDSPTMPMITKFPDLQDILAETVSTVMAKQSSPDDAVSAAAKKMQQALES